MNHHRGEVKVRLNGKDYILCLTLGALAELESAFKVRSIRELALYFETNRLSANDIIKILVIAIRGGGAQISEESVTDFAHENGLIGFLDIIKNFFETSFGCSIQMTEIKQNPMLP